MNQLPLSFSHLSEEDSIEELHLTNRSFNALTRAGIRTVGEVSRLVSSGRLKSISGLGKKSISEIKAKLAHVEGLDDSSVDFSVERKINAFSDQDYVYLSAEDPIEKLNLSRRSFNALTQINIRVVGEVLQLAESGRLRTIRGLGRKCLLEIKENLAQAKILGATGVEAHVYLIPDGVADALSQEDQIEKLNLSTRSFNALSRAGIRTVGRVLQLVKSGELGRISALGRESILEIAATFVQIRIKDGVDADNSEKINAIPEEVIRWQAQLVGKQLSRGLLHENARIAGRSIKDWLTSIKTPENNQVYQVFALILNSSLNMCEEIEFFCNQISQQHYITTLLSLYGFKANTLEQTGSELGISRERVRQIRNELVVKLTGGVRAIVETTSINNLKSNPALLRMQSALLIAKDFNLDITYEQWTQQIQSSGLVGDWISQNFVGTNAIEIMIAMCNLWKEFKIRYLEMPENLVYAAQLAALGMPNVPAKIPYARETLSDEVKRLINRHKQHSGAVHAKWLSQESGIGLEGIKDILQGLDYRTLSEDWFVQDSPDDSRHISYHDVFHHGLRKMFQYCGPLGIDNVCSGLRHVISKTKFPIPSPDIMDRLVRIYDYTCEDELYYWDGTYGEELNAGETIIMNCFDCFGPVLHHSELVDAFVESDRSFPLLHATLRRSPLFETIEVGLYKLRGHNVVYQDIERARAAGKQQSLDLEEEYDPSGNIMLSITLGSVAVGLGTIHCEQFRDLSGNWPCYVDGVNAGELIATENEFRHLRKSFELLGCKPGDRLKFIFNMWKRTGRNQCTTLNSQMWKSLP